MIGRADIEGLKSNVAMNACAASQACYSCGGGGGEGGYNETVQFEQRGVLLMCIHLVKRWYILFYRGEINDNYCHLIYIVTFLRHSLDHIGYSAYDSQLGVD